jgi:hypothetical protein
VADLDDGILRLSAGGGQQRQGGGGVLQFHAISKVVMRCVIIAKNAKYYRASWPFKRWLFKI